MLIDGGSAVRLHIVLLVNIGSQSQARSWLPDSSVCDDELSSARGTSQTLVTLSFNYPVSIACVEKQSLVHWIRNAEPTIDTRRNDADHPPPNPPGDDQDF